MILSQKRVVVLSWAVAAEDGGKPRVSNDWRPRLDFQAGRVPMLVLFQGHDCIPWRLGGECSQIGVIFTDWFVSCYCLLPWNHMCGECWMPWTASLTGLKRNSNVVVDWKDREISLFYAVLCVSWSGTRDVCPPFSDSMVYQAWSQFHNHSCFTLTRCSC